MVKVMWGVDLGVCLPEGLLDPLCLSASRVKGIVCLFPPEAQKQGLMARRWPHTSLNGIPALLFLGSAGFIFSSILGKQ